MRDDRSIKIDDLINALPILEQAMVVASTCSSALEGEVQKRPKRSFICLFYTKVMFPYMVKGDNLSRNVTLS